MMSTTHLCFSPAGGKVTFNVGNDSPTLTGAKVTFTIDLEFPHNQKVQPDGDVVWAEDCTVNGTKYRQSEPVYPTLKTDWEPVFPDGTPLKDDKKPSYVFVWKTWGESCGWARPREVCSVILDAECLRPIHTVCNMVEPSKECQMVLRHFFNDSGTYCINVSMANDVSLAATSAKLNLEMGTHKTSHTTARLTNRQLVWLNSSSAPSGPSASYRRLKEGLIGSADQKPSSDQSSSRSSIIWNLLNRRGAVDNCPLLQDRPL
uniref:Premelanosome protein b n=1 Tax=Echeneis naucrates TaxID=173247 RepID=A0A665V6U3_ECHNA